MLTKSEIAIMTSEEAEAAKTDDTGHNFEFTI